MGSFWNGQLVGFGLFCEFGEGEAVVETAHEVDPGRGVVLDEGEGLLPR